MWISAAIVGAAVIGGGAAIIASNNAADAQSDAATYAADLEYKAQQDALGASARATEAMAAATTQAAYMQAEAAKYAADKQLAAANEALALKKKQWEKMQADMQPYLSAGGAGLNQLSYGLGLSGYSNGSTNSALQSGYLSKPFSEEDFKVDPGYEFRLSEGLKALDRSASAKGNLLSGSALKGIERFGQGLASQEYQAAYNRYTNDQATQYNQLQNLTNMGQSTAVGMGNAGMNYANSYGDTLMGATSAANSYNLSAAASNANALTANAQYGMNQTQYANSLGLAGANTLGNAALAKANANASSYMGYANAANSFANALGQYYTYGGRVGGSNSASYAYNPNGFRNYNANQWVGTSNYDY